MHKLMVQTTRPQAKLPTKAHPGDLGYDIYAAAPAVLLPGDWSVVQSGIALALPPMVAGLVLPRSGLAAKLGVTVLNAPGLIDCGYRGEIGVVLINHGDEPFHVGVGDRIAQLLLVQTSPAELEFCQSLPQPEDDRGAMGFGSSGV